MDADSHVYEYIELSPKSVPFDSKTGGTLFHRSSGTVKYIAGPTLPSPPKLCDGTNIYAAPSSDDPWNFLGSVCIGSKTIYLGPLIIVILVVIVFLYLLVVYVKKVRRNLKQIRHVDIELGRY